MKLPSIKSPLRYPGGKSRAIKQITPIVPEFKEFREPMVGGGSVFFAFKQLKPNAGFWINDCNKELYFFWKYCKEEVNKLIEEIKNIKEKELDGKKLHKELLNESKNRSDFQRAVRFFILNRITFSGLAESGGYSNMAFKGRFTDSSIERLKKASEILQNTKTTNEDYTTLLFKPGEEVFIFLDPPYYSTTKSKLYGKKGCLHEEFNHEKFAADMKKCEHKWLITYDDCEEIRKLFKFANIYTWKLQYGMNNYKQKNASKGNELFISNYEIDLLKERKV
ncbi:MAG: DNA adenine methylase [archaeon]